MDTLHARIKRYAITCPRDRLEATYEFVSMLEFYDPVWWRGLMRLRGCGEMTGKPRKGQPDAGPEELALLSRGT